MSDIWSIISHNWALISILLTVVLLVIIPALVLAKYVRISLNILRDTEPPLAMPPLGYECIAGEDVEFWARDGIRLTGVFLHPPPGVARRGLIVFAPEFKSTRLSCTRYCRHLIEAGYDVFSFDFRGNGRSAVEAGYTPRAWASDREVRDMQAAIAYAEAWLEQRKRPAEIGLYGISRGACAALLATAEQTCVRAIVTDGAFSSDCTLEHLMRKWASIFAKVRIIYENHPPEFWRFLRWCLIATARFKLKCRFPSVRKALMRTPPRPILFIHGDRDSYIPVEQSRLLYALSSQPKHLWIVPKAKHNRSIDVAPREYAHRTQDFFDKYLAGRIDPLNIYDESRFEDRIYGRGIAGRVGTIREAEIPTSPTMPARVTSDLTIKAPAANRRFA